MASKKKSVKRSLSPKTIIRYLLLVLLVFKIIGDVVILTASAIFSFTYTTYKTLSTVLRQVKNNIALFAPSFLKKETPSKKVSSKALRKYFQKTKHRIIYLSNLPTIIVNKIATSVKIKIIQIKLTIYRAITSIKSSIKRFLASRLFLKIKFFTFGALTVAAIATFYQINLIVASLPNPTSLTLRDIATTTKIYDRGGTLLYEIYMDENRTPVKLQDVPDIVKQATISIEDQTFYSHQGFSIPGIVRAIIRNLTSNNLEGGSTITQQLIRSALLTSEKTLTRKLKELILAFWTERLYSKDEILEMYLNQVPYGGTAWGIEAAAETYFGKSVSHLTLAEAALLAGLPAAPTRYSPFGAHPELSQARQEEVLRRMVEDGYITESQKSKVKSQKLEFKPQRVPILAPHFVMYVKDLLEKHYGPRLVAKGGLRVTTTVDLSLQNQTEKIIANHVENLKKLNVGNGAVLITDPGKGEILAMVGSADYFNTEEEGNVNVSLSLRQPGSSIKAVTYSAALANGFSTASILDDSPITYRISGQPPYSPVNYDGRFHGKIPLRVAFASSYNVPAVKVLSQIGIDQMIEQGKQMGITSWEDSSRFGLSLTLGGGEVTMLDMAKVYGTLATGGKRTNLSPFLSITNYKGESIPLPPRKNSVQVVSPAIAFIISSILSDNRARTPAFGSSSLLVIPGKTVAAKTGTSDNKRDNWAIGYTPDFVVVAWVGNNDNSPMHPTLTSGVTGATPIWHDITIELLKEKQDKPFTIPQNIVALPCYGITEYFIAGAEPKGGCPQLPEREPTISISQ